jgi:hypothetical protein
MRMKNLSRIGHIVLFAVAMLTGCDDPEEVPPDGNEDSNTACPADLPENGTACGDVGQSCNTQYLIQSCECGPSDIYWECTCEASGWACVQNDADCYPCDGGTADCGTVCAECPEELPANGSDCTGHVGQECNDLYVIEVCECGPDDVTWNCTCEESGWSCEQTEADCYPCDGGVPPDASFAQPS